MALVPDEPLNFLVVRALRTIVDPLLLTGAGRALSESNGFNKAALSTTQLMAQRRGRLMAAPCCVQVCLAKTRPASAQSKFLEMLSFWATWSVRGTR